MNEGQQLTVLFKAQNIPQKLPENIEINLFRVVQELLQNINKHAGAAHVWLQLMNEAGGRASYAGYPVNAPACEASRF